MPDQQLPISVSHRCEERKSAPEDRAQNDDHFARVPVGKRTGKGRGNHVKAEKSAREISDLGVGEMKFGLHQRLHRKQHRTVDVVQQVQRRQQNQRRPRVEFRLGHLAKEYITVGLKDLWILLTISLLTVTLRIHNYHSEADMEYPQTEVKNECCFAMSRLPEGESLQPEASPTTSQPSLCGRPQRSCYVLPGCE